MLCVAASRELPALLGPDGDPEAAIEDGSIRKEKLRGRWLYLLQDLDLRDALDRALEAAESYLEECLLGRPPYLVPGALRQCSVEIGRGAMDLLIKQLAAEGRLGGIALLNVYYQPFLAFFRREDAEEIARQVDALARSLERSRRVRSSDLPSPTRPVPRQVWRDAILKHGEWLGWGELEDGDLVAWR